MSKKQTVHLNWNNKSLMNVVHYLHYCEGRLSKEELIRQGTKTLFYQLKKGGYIKEIESSKGMFKATEKLKNQYTIHINPKSAWGGAGSSLHSKGMVQAISVLPQSALGDGRIKTEEIIKKEFNTFKKTEGYKLALEKEQAYYKEQISLLNAQKHDSSLNEAKYELLRESLLLKANVLASDRPVSVPDLEVTLHKEELPAMRERMEEMLEHTHQMREQEIWQAAICKMVEIEQTIETTVELCVEVVTSQYTATDIQAKYNYERLCNKIMILIPAPE